MIANKAVLLLLTLLLIGWSQQGVSMDCFDKKMNAPIISLSTPIKVPTTVKPGTVIWRSLVVPQLINCEDRKTKGLLVKLEGVNANFYSDPSKMLMSLDKSIEIGITFRGVDYPLDYGSRVRIGLALQCLPFCNAQSAVYAKGNIYTSSNIDIPFQVYVKATGLPPPPSGKIMDSATYQLFKIGDDNGLNAIPIGNFSASVSGLNNISFISCKPNINVLGTSGSTVNFGSIPQKNSLVGNVEKQLPFSVSVDMSSADNGQACAGTTMQASFSSTYPVRDGTMLMPAIDSGFGIELSQASTPNTPIVFNQNIDLGLTNGTIVQNRFFAGLKWLSATPRIGPFTASVTVDVTFK